MIEAETDQGAWGATYEEARRAFPGVAADLTLAEFIAHARRAGACDAASAPYGSELFLACGCATGDVRAIVTLESGYLPAARASLARFSADSDFADEVVQELRAKLLLGPAPRIARYAGRGPLLAWIRVAASRLAIDLLRAEEAPSPEPPDGAAPADIDLGPEVRLLREVYRESFREALAQALGGLSAAERNLLRRHLVDRLTLQEIAVPYGVHTATIARRLPSLRERIAGAVRDALANRYRADGGAASLESLARAIRSEIEVSLSPLLSTGPGSQGRRPPSYHLSGKE